jgi:hypothetical protein
MFSSHFGWFHQWQRMALHSLFYHEHHFFPLQILLRLPVHNIYKNKLAMNFSSSFSFRVKKSNYCTNFTFGGILNRRGHFNHTLRAQICRDCGRWTQPCHTVSISHSSTAISEKNSLAALLDLYLYFPDIPHGYLSKIIFLPITLVTPSETYGPTLSSSGENIDPHQQKYWHKAALDKNIYPHEATLKKNSDTLW